MPDAAVLHHGAKPTEEQIRFSQLAQRGIREQEVKERIARVRECVQEVGEDRVLDVLHMCNYDVARTIAAFLDGEAAKAVDDWEETTPRKKGKRKDQSHSQPPREREAAWMASSDEAHTSRVPRRAIATKELRRRGRGGSPLATVPANCGDSWHAAAADAKAPRENGSEPKSATATTAKGDEVAARRRRGGRRERERLEKKKARELAAQTAPETAVADGGIGLTTARAKPTKTGPSRSALRRERRAQNPKPLADATADVAKPVIGGEAVPDVTADLAPSAEPASGLASPAPQPSESAPPELPQEVPAPIVVEVVAKAPEPPKRYVRISRATTPLDERVVLPASTSLATDSLPIAFGVTAELEPEIDDATDVPQRQTVPIDLVPGKEVPTSQAAAPDASWPAAPVAHLAVANGNMAPIPDVTATVPGAAHMPFYPWELMPHPPAPLGYGAEGLDPALQYGAYYQAPPHPQLHPHMWGYPPFDQEPPMAQFFEPGSRAPGSRDDRRPEPQYHGKGTAMPPGSPRGLGPHANAGMPLPPKPNTFDYLGVPMYSSHANGPIPMPQAPGPATANAQFNGSGANNTNQRSSPRQHAFPASVPVGHDGVHGNGQRQPFYPAYGPTYGPGAYAQPLYPPPFMRPQGGPPPRVGGASPVAMGPYAHAPMGAPDDEKYVPPPPKFHRNERRYGHRNGGPSKAQDYHARIHSPPPAMQPYGPPYIPNAAY